MEIGSNAAYFITICTKNRKHFFGEIQDKKLKVSSAGAIAFILWHEIRYHTNNIDLGKFVVMPNHIHGILILKGNNGRNVACNVPTGSKPEPKSEPGSKPTNETKNKQMSSISPKINTVSAIIRSYKSAVTKYCNLLELPFAWQSRFHDHIIRDDESFQRISEYIKNNPANWKEDTFNRFS